LAFERDGDNVLRLVLVQLVEDQRVQVGFRHRGFVQGTGTGRRSARLSYQSRVCSWVWEGKRKACGAINASCNLVDPGMRHIVPGRWPAEAEGPVGIRAANFGGRTRIGVDTQLNQRGSAPFTPVSEA